MSKSTEQSQPTIHDADTPMANAYRDIAHNHAEAAKDDALHIALDHYDVLSKGLANADENGRVPDDLFTDEEQSVIESLEKYDSDRPEVIEAALDLVETMSKGEAKTAKRSEKLSAVRTKIDRAKRLGLDQAEIDDLIEREQKLVAKLEKQKGKEENAISKVHARVKKEASDRVLDRAETADPFEFWGYKEPSSAAARNDGHVTTTETTHSDVSDVETDEPPVTSEQPKDETSTDPAPSARPSRSAREKALAAADSSSEADDDASVPANEDTSRATVMGLFDELKRVLGENPEAIEAQFIAEEISRVIADPNSNFTDREISGMFELLSNMRGGAKADVVDEDPAWQEPGAGDDEFDVPSFLRGPVPPPAAPVDDELAGRLKGARHGVPGAGDDSAARHHDDPPAPALGDVTPSGEFDALADAAEPVAVADETRIDADHEAGAEKLTLRVGYDQDNSVHGQDSMLVSQELGLFAVMDGVSSAVHSRLVADETAARLFARYRELPEARTIDEALAQMKQVFGATANDVADMEFPTQESGVTTVTAVKVFKDPATGKSWAILANAGDSRADIGYPDGWLARVSEDQNWDSPDGPIMSNGFGKFEDGISYNESGRFSNQFEVFELRDGARIVLGTDGIAGDAREPDTHLTDAEIVQQLRTESVDEATENLMDASKKIDDKSVIVVEVGDKSSEWAGDVPALAEGTPAGPEADTKAKEPKWKKLGKGILGGIDRFVGRAQAEGRSLTQDRLAPVDDPSRDGPRPTPSARRAASADATPSRSTDEAPRVAESVPAATATPVETTVVEAEPAAPAAEAEPAPVAQAPTEVVDIEQAARRQEARSLVREIRDGFADGSLPRGSAEFNELNQRLVGLIQQEYPNNEAAARAALARLMRGEDLFGADEE